MRFIFYPLEPYDKLAAYPKYNKRKILQSLKSPQPQLNVKYCTSKSQVNHNRPWRSRGHKTLPIRQ